MKRFVGVGWPVNTVPMKRVSTEKSGWEEGDVSMPSSIHPARIRVKVDIRTMLRSVFIFLDSYACT